MNFNFLLKERIQLNSYALTDRKGTKFHHDVLFERKPCRGSYVQPKRGTASFGIADPRFGSMQLMRSSFFLPCTSASLHDQMCLG